MEKKETEVPRSMGMLIIEARKKLLELLDMFSSLTPLNHSGNITGVIQGMQGEKMFNVPAIQLYETKQWGTRQLNVCQKCGWPWFSKVAGTTPQQCPKCNDDAWQRDYVQGPRTKGTLADGAND